MRRGWFALTLLVMLSLTAVAFGGQGQPASASGARSAQYLENAPAGQAKRSAGQRAGGATTFVKRGKRSRGLTTGFLDPLFKSADPTVRATWLDAAVQDGAGIVRINVAWSSVVGSTPPARPTDPADPDYSFSSLDQEVRDARARGLDVLLTVLSAPKWATGKHRPEGVPPGSWKPDPRALGQFAQALARRYSGSFGGLPRIRYFEVWNEPNLTLYLAPQWRGKKRKSPQLYRRMLNAFYAGVNKAQPHAKVIGGAVSPFGDPRKNPLNPARPRIRPLIFLRDLFCLNRRMKPAKGCRGKPHLDVLSQHPINSVNPPHYHAISPNDIQVADFHRVRRVLHAAERANHVRPRRHHALWATELFWWTDPPTAGKVPVQKHAKWLEESLYLLWKQGASAAVNLEVRDPQSPRSGNPATGVFFYDGTKKPAYQTFRFPFVTHRQSKRGVGVWGKAPLSGTLEIQKHGGNGWKTVKTLEVRAGAVFTSSIKLGRSAELRGKIGGETSLPWHQSG